MKFTSKKTVSEVVIDLEDGCILKLTRNNVNNLKVDISPESSFTSVYYVVKIEMRNGINCIFKTKDQLLIDSLRMLYTY